MSKQSTLDKLENEIKNVKREVNILRSFAIVIAGKDPEGEYRPEFVREILRAVNEKAPFKFTTPETFLKNIDRA